MAQHHIDKWLKNFLKQIFFVVGSNSPYNITDFLAILVTASLTPDFINNTSVKTQPAPNGQTVFNRLFKCSNERIWETFNRIMKPLIKRVKPRLKFRKQVLAFDTTYEPFYGDINSNPFWIHDYKPVRGCTGCFIFITVSIVVGNGKFILGSLPVPRGWNKADYVEKLINQARKYVRIEACLLDRGFGSYEVIDRLKKLRVHYQILWKKDTKRETWLTKELSKLSSGEMESILRKMAILIKIRAGIM